MTPLAEAMPLAVTMQRQLLSDFETCVAVTCGVYMDSRVTVLNHSLIPSFILTSLKNAFLPGFCFIRVLSTLASVYSDTSRGSYDNNSRLWGSYYPGVAII